MPPSAKPTLYAQRGLEFVAVFQVRFHALDISGHKARLRPPPGESTGGGKLATQHIVLEPDDPSAPTWTVGSVNVATKSAKIRTYDCVRALHRARFKDKAFPLDRGHYQSFFETATALMKEREVSVEIENAPPEIALETSGRDGSGGASDALAAPSRGGLGWVIIGALILAVIAAAGAFIALRKFAHML